MRIEIKNIDVTVVKQLDILVEKSGCKNRSEYLNKLITNHVSQADPLYNEQISSYERLVKIVSESISEQNERLNTQEEYLLDILSEVRKLVK